MDRFFADAAKGTLPALTWIDPRQGINKTLGNLGGPNSDHPSCCDVALGERLRKDIYEALRSGPGWNHTAFICVEIKILRRVLNHRIVLHAIDAAPARRRGGASSSPRTEPGRPLHRREIS